jgi:hypothetical protein
MNERTGTTLSTLQAAFLSALRQAPQRAAAHLDASMIGPLIRANLVQWDDEPDATGRRQVPHSTFSLTHLGAECLAAHEAA